MERERRQERERESVCVCARARARACDFRVCVGGTGDGKGDAARELLPEYNAEEREVHITITTVEGGHNSGD